MGALEAVRRFLRFGKTSDVSQVGQEICEVVLELADKVETLEMELAKLKAEFEKEKQANELRNSV